MSYEIKTHGGFGRELQRIARDELERALDALQFLQRDSIGTGPHEVRKRLKKLRAVLLLLREPLGKKRHREEDAILRDLGRALATLRDAQALLKTLQKVQRRFFSNKPPAILRAVRRELERHERRSATAFLNSFIPDRSIASIHAALDRVADWPVEGYGWKQLRRAVKCSYRHSREAGARAHESPDDKRLHRWRQRVKDVWFHLRLLRRICPALIEELAQDYDALGEFLGDDHDLVMLRAALLERRGALAEDAALDSFLELLELRREELLASAFDLGERLHADAPAVFARELSDHRSAARARRRKVKKLASRLAVAR